MGLVFNDASPPVELAGSKLHSRSLGGSMYGSFTFYGGWLLCERGAGSGERGVGISYFNI
jgi:hypothetical protein